MRLKLPIVRKDDVIELPDELKIADSELAIADRTNAGLRNLGNTC